MAAVRDVVADTLSGGSSWTALARPSRLVLRRNTQQPPPLRLPPALPLPSPSPLCRSLSPWPRRQALASRRAIGFKRQDRPNTHPNTHTHTHTHKHTHTNTHTHTHTYIHTVVAQKDDPEGGRVQGSAGSASPAEPRDIWALSVPRAASVAKRKKPSPSECVCMCVCV